MASMGRPRSSRRWAARRPAQALLPTQRDSDSVGARWNEAGLVAAVAAVAVAAVAVAHTGTAAVTQHRRREPGLATSVAIRGLPMPQNTGKMATKVANAAPRLITPLSSSQSQQ